MSLIQFTSIGNFVSRKSSAFNTIGEAGATATTAGYHHRGWSAGRHGACGAGTLPGGTAGGLRGVWQPAAKSYLGYTALHQPGRSGVLQICMLELSFKRFMLISRYYCALYSISLIWYFFHFVGKYILINDVIFFFCFRAKSHGKRI